MLISEGDYYQTKIDSQIDLEDEKRERDENLLADITKEDLAGKVRF